MDKQFCNIAFELKKQAKLHPDKPAVLSPAGRDPGGHPNYRQLTFAQLDRLSDEYARGLRDYGVGRGVKTLLMIRPGLDFYAVTFALFKNGAVPVMIDPGMGVRRLLHCIKAAQPQAMVGIPLAHLMRVLRPGYFKSVEYCVTVGRRFFWRGRELRDMLIAGMPLEMAKTAEDDLAAILFTTGSTGPAKGVEYEHGMFARQCGIIEKTYGIGGDDIDLPTFPLFGLFSVALGMTVVIPDMDPTRPAEVNPQRIIEAVENQGCTFSFGSPALWGKVSKYCVDAGIKLPSLRNILIAGAPVPVEVHERLLEHVLPEGASVHTPYGATESLPSCNITGNEILQETATLTLEGKGVCVGRPVDGVEVEIIKITDEAIQEWSDDLTVPQGQVGEIVTKGKNVTKCYHQLPEHTRMAKILDGECVRHRIGDLGYQDEKGRIWFCGRKAHRVETVKGLMLSVCCEAILNRHDKVKRSALVGLGQRPAQKPVMIVELHHPHISHKQKELIKSELLHMAAGSTLTEDIKDVLFHPSFPVDIRHNAKINREELTLWAGRKIRKA